MNCQYCQSTLHGKVCRNIYCYDITTKSQETPGIGFAKPKSQETPGLQQKELPSTTATRGLNRRVFNDDTTTPPWWTLLSLKEAQKKIDADAKATLKAIQEKEAKKALEAEAAKDGKDKEDAEAKSHTKKACNFSPLHALYFAMVINKEAVKQGDNGWTGWKAPPLKTKTVQPPFLKPFSSYEQFRASRGRPMVYSEESKRHVMLLPGAQPIENVQSKAIEDWQKMMAGASTQSICGLQRTMSVQHKLE